MAAKFVHLWQQELVKQFVHISVDWETYGIRSRAKLQPSRPTPSSLQLPARAYFQNILRLPKLASTSGDQVFKYMGLWGNISYSNHNKHTTSSFSSFRSTSRLNSLVESSADFKEPFLCPMPTLVLLLLPSIFLWLFHQQTAGYRSLWLFSFSPLSTVPHDGTYHIIKTH